MSDRHKRQTRTISMLPGAVRSPDVAERFNELLAALDLIRRVALAAFERGEAVALKSEGVAEPDGDELRSVGAVFTVAVGRPAREAI